MGQITQCACCGVWVVSQATHLEVGKCSNGIASLAVSVLSAGSVTLSGASLGVFGTTTYAATVLPGSVVDAR